MRLVTENSQGELSSLEIGIHALRAVPKEAGGCGKKGGLSEYAEAIGKTQQYVSQLRDAAEVATKNSQVDLCLLVDKAQHLSLIHKLPRSVWPVACEHVASAELSTREVGELVEAANACCEAPVQTEYAQEDLTTVSAAKCVGKTRRCKSQLRDAAEVFDKRVKPTHQLVSSQDKA